MTDRGVIGPERSLGRITYPWSGLAVSLPVCALMGALTALAFAPYFVLPLVLVGFAAFALFIRHCGGSGAALLIGWGFGIGQFLVGLRWISESFFVDAVRFGALAWPAVLGLSGFLALFPAFAAAATRYLGGRGPIAFLMFPGFWTLAEMARGVLFTGFPWNLTGYVWGFSDATLQPMSAIGVHGVGFVTVMICMVPLALAERYRLRPWAFAVPIVVVPMLGAGFCFRSGSACKRRNRRRCWSLDCVVQPNIPQDQNGIQTRQRGTFGSCMTSVRRPLPSGHGSSYGRKQHIRISIPTMSAFRKLYSGAFPRMVCCCSARYELPRETTKLGDC